MNLKEYLESENLTLRAFADIVGIHWNTIQNIKKGKRPYKKNAERIEKVTHGKVKASDLLAQEKWIREYIYR